MSAMLGPSTWNACPAMPLVYAPAVTTLLRAAKACGLQTADGLGMLLYRAVRGLQE
jgi:shikimate 5-dehydrogenase